MPGKTECAGETRKKTPRLGPNSCLDDANPFEKRTEFSKSPCSTLLAFSTFARCNQQAMTQEPINPYQPVASLTDENEHGLSEIQFQLTRRILRSGESKYLTHSSSNRRLIDSLVIIALSTMIFIVAVSYGKYTFISSMIMTLVGATFVFSALLHRSKIEARQNLSRYGMVDGAVCTVSMSAGDVTFTTPAGKFHWPASSLKIYRTPKGHLLLPRERVFLIIPKANDSTRAEYKQLIKAIKSH